MSPKLANFFPCEKEFNASASRLIALNVVVSYSSNALGSNLWGRKKWRAPAKCSARLWEGKNERDGEGPLFLSGFIGRFAIYSSTSERMNKLSPSGTKKAAFYASLTPQSPYSARG